MEIDFHRRQVFILSLDYAVEFSLGGIIQEYVDHVVIVNKEATDRY